MIDSTNLINTMQKKLDQLKKKHPRPEDLDQFFVLYKRFIETKNIKLDWNMIEKPKGKLFEYKDLEDAIDPQALLKRLAVLKLNGGLGTTMGCNGPKSAIKVNKENNFLDITVAQIENLNNTYGSDVPLLLMNSFNTDKETIEMTKKYTGIKMFTQSMFPRISEDDLLPVESESQLFYPPGHGDLFYAIEKSGKLDELLEEGRDYLFVSNVDNLAATVDLKILSFLVENNIDFGMEVTKKTRADIKGGTLINYDGSLRLLEIAQVPSDKKSDFKCIRNFPIFNTNSVWINLRVFKEISKNISLDLIQNRKIIGDTPIIQLETAIGSAVRYFSNNCGIVVPRSRFLPIKTCDDLFLLKSNIYMEENSQIRINTERILPNLPVVKLVGQNFNNVGSFEKSFGTIPNIVDLETLIIIGNVTFGKNVVLKGTVIINATEGGAITIPDGAIIEDNIICGSLPFINL